METLADRAAYYGGATADVLLATQSPSQAPRNLYRSLNYRKGKLSGRDSSGCTEALSDRSLDRGHELRGHRPSGAHRSKQAAKLEQRHLR